jgi:catechol 2,3-dioxygenase-like lactoylglutathione lyase family enzyme
MSELVPNACHSLRHVGIVVNDIEKSLKFWIQLGLQVKSDQLEENPFISRLLGFEVNYLRTVKLMAKDSEVLLELLSFDSATVDAKRETQPNSLGITHIALNVISITDAADVIYIFGGQIVSDAILSAQSGRLEVAYFKTFDGVLLELVQEQRN